MATVLKTRSDIEQYLSVMNGMLTRIFQKNQNLVHLANSVTFGYTQQNAYNATYNLTFSVDQCYEHADYYGSSQSLGSVRLCNFTPKSLPRINMSSSFSEFVNFDRNNMRRIGINICRNINVKGYMLDYTSIKKIIEDPYFRNNGSILDSLYEIYYIGKRNTFLGALTRDGSLYIRNQTIVKLLQTNHADVIESCLTNLLICFERSIRLVFDGDISEYKNKIFKEIEPKILDKVLRSAENYSRFSGVDNDDLKRHIISHVKNAVEDVFEGTVFGVSDKYSYARLIREIIKAQSIKSQQSFNEGFSSGLTIGMKLELLGWEVENVHPASSTDKQGMWWSKEIDLTPRIFIKDGLSRKIHKDHTKHHISKLFINHKGYLHCEGNHPNVSGTSVCMGDLEIDFSADSDTIQNRLKDAERLLEIINYDSSYNSTHEKYYEHHSEPIDITDESITITVDNNGSNGIQSLSDFVVDDEEGDIDDEVIETIKEIQLKKINHNVRDSDDTILATKISDEVYEPTNYDRSIDSLETNEDIESDLETNLNVISRDISIVDSEGNRSYVRTQNNLSLGDANLVSTSGR